MNALAGRLHLDFRADDPIYVQIVRQIEALVAEGTLKPGDQLPTVRELAIDLRINFSTVARAYRILDEQRLISTQRGRGTYISDDHEAAAGKVQEQAGSRVTADRKIADREISENLSGLMQQLIREAAETGASAEQIEQAFRQQMEDWKRNHPNHSGNNFGG